MVLKRYNREPLKRWHYLATCMSRSLTDYQIDAIVNNDNTKYYTLFSAKVEYSRDGESKRERTRECTLLYTNTPLGREK